MREEIGNKNDAAADGESAIRWKFKGAEDGCLIIEIQR